MSCVHQESVGGYSTLLGQVEGEGEGRLAGWLLSRGEWTHTVRGTHWSAAQACSVAAVCLSGWLATLCLRRCGVRFLWVSARLRGRGGVHVVCRVDRGVRVCEVAYRCIPDCWLWLLLLALLLVVVVVVPLGWRIWCGLRSALDPRAHAAPDSGGYKVLAALAVSCVLAALPSWLAAITAAPCPVATNAAAGAAGHRPRPQAGRDRHPPSVGDDRLLHVAERTGRRAAAAAPNRPATVRHARPSLRTRAASFTALP